VNPPEHTFPLALNSSLGRASPSGGSDQPVLKGLSLFFAGKGPGRLFVFLCCGLPDPNLSALPVRCYSRTSFSTCWSTGTSL
jgi:hypothetical protein